MKRKHTEEFKEPTEKKSKDESEKPEQTDSCDQNGHTKYEDSFSEFMASVIVKSSSALGYDFDNAGENLVSHMRSCADSDSFTRDYETECTEARKSYQVLTSRIEEIRQTTSSDACIQPINRFVLSIKAFLRGVIRGAFGDDILSDNHTQDQSISDASILHDTFEQILKLLANKDIFILGDLGEGLGK